MATTCAVPSGSRYSTLEVQPGFHRSYTRSSVGKTGVPTVTVSVSFPCHAATVGIHASQVLPQPVGLPVLAILL